MTVHSITADRLPATRRGAWRYLRRTAPALWTGLIEDYPDMFRAPPEARHFAPKELGPWLAAAEARRVAKAKLYFFDEAATQLMVYTSAIYKERYVLHPELVPCDHGMVVWAEDVSHTEKGVPIIAFHWEVREDGVWLGFWADAASEALRVIKDGESLDPYEFFAVHGALLYEREDLLPWAKGVHGEAIVPDMQMAARVHNLESVVLATMASLALGRLPSTELPDPGDVVMGMPRIPGGADDRVHVVTAPPGITPDNIWSARFPPHAGKVL